MLTHKNFQTEVTFDLDDLKGMPGFNNNLNPKEINEVLKTNGIFNDLNPDDEINHPMYGKIYILYTSEEKTWIFMDRVNEYIERSKKLPAFPALQ